MVDCNNVTFIFVDSYQNSYPFYLRVHTELAGVCYDIESNKTET